MSGTKCGVLLEIGGNIGLVGQWYVVAATLLDEGTLLCKKQFGLDLVFFIVISLAIRQFFFKNVTHLKYVHKTQKRQNSHTQPHKDKIFLKFSNFIKKFQTRTHTFIQI